MLPVGKEQAAAKLPLPVKLPEGRGQLQVHLHVEGVHFVGAVEAHEEHVASFLDGDLLFVHRQPLLFMD
jgi:hypothetical protein